MQSGEEQEYPVNNLALPMRRVFNRHCHRYGWQRTSCRFLDDGGQRVDADQIFQDMMGNNLPEDDGTTFVYLDCMLEQIGGRRNVSFW